MKYFLSVLRIFIFVGFAISSDAQVVEGILLLEDGGEPSGAVVSLENLMGQMVSQTTLLDGNRWALKVPSGGLYTFRANFLGYEAYDTLLRIKQDTLYLPVLLRRKVFDLSGVEVFGKRMGVKVMGDTVRYEVDVFLDTLDRDLEDVLEKMPGVEISESRQIFFYGKRVDVLLIDGHNVLNNQHQLALEHVPLRQVESIDFIQHYKEEIDADEVEQSELTAMDIHFKEEAKSRPSAAILILALNGIKSSFFVLLGDRTKRLFKDEESRGI